MGAQRAAVLAARVIVRRWRRVLGAVGCAALAGAVASCDATKALRPGGQAKVEIEFAGDSTVVVGSTVPVQFTVTVDGKEYKFPRLEVVSSDTSVIAFGADGRSLVAKRRGRATVTARFISAVLPEPPAVAQPIYVVAKSAQVDRPALTLTSFGDTAHLAVRATDANDEPLPALAPRWSSTDTTVAAVSAEGVVTARGNGRASVRAVVDFDTVVTSVTVQQQLARFVFPAPTVALDALGASGMLEVVGLDARGNPITTVSGAGALWEVADGRVASVTPAGAVVALSNGETWARATAVGGAVRDSVRVQVAQRAAKVIIQTPGPVSLSAVGAKKKVDALAFDRLDRPVTNNIPVWVSRNPRVAHVDTLLAQVTAIDTGATWVLARLNDAADSVEVRVSNAPARVVLDADARTLSSVGDTLRLTATVENSVPTPIPGWPVAWHSTDSAIVRVLGDGRAVAVGAGVARVIAAAVGSDVADTAAITVTNSVARLDVVPASVVLESVHDTLLLPVLLENARGLPIADRAAVDWKSDEADVVRVTAVGAVIALRTGSTMVRALGRNGSPVRDSVLVVVTNAPASIRLDVHADTISAVGKERVYAAEVRNRRGDEIAGYRPEWTSRRPQVARAAAEELAGSSRGVVTAVGEGVAWVVARAGTSADSVEVTVGNIPTSLQLDRDSVTMSSVGDTVVLRATARNEIQVPVPSVPLSWHTPDTAIVRLDPTRPGAVVARAPGTTLVIASYGTLADTTVVTVVNAASRVNIVATDTLLTSVGDTARPGVEIFTARGVPLDRSAVSWTVDDPVVLRVTSAGELIARDTGTVLVRATSRTHASARDSIVVVVRNVPASLVLGEQSVSLTAVGRVHQVSAEVRNARGALISGVVPSWRSTAPAVATVSAAGVVTATGGGSALIIAQAGAVADTLAVTVSNVLVSIDLTPATATLTSVGDTIALRVVVRNEIGLEVTGVATTWRTPDVTVGRVLDDGRVIGLTTGTVRVIATVGTLVDTARVTVANYVVVTDIVPTELTLASIGDTAAPAVRVTNGRAVDVGRAAAVWSSDDPAVASVSAQGVITARAAGKTQIRTTSGQVPGVFDSLLVTVTNAPASVVLSADVDTLPAIRFPRTYTAEVRNSRGTLVPTVPTWRSTAPAVATVTTAGVVTAAGIGSALIIAQAGEVADTLRLTVLDKAYFIEVTPSSAVLPSVADTLRLTTTVRNLLNLPVAGSPVPSWYAEDTSVARVLPDGRVIGVAVGTTRVIATLEALADTSIVTVLNAPASVDIVPASLALTFLGDSAAPAADIRNARGAQLPRSSVTWTSDDPAIARVSAAGVVSARDVGRTTVRAASPLAPWLRDSIIVNVSNDATSVTISGAAEVDTLAATGQTLALEATALNSAGAPVAAGAISWRSTNSVVASVSASGLVTSMGFGSALIIAQSGAVADTAVLVVRNPTRLFVDNGGYVAGPIGTASRPYTRIQDAVNAADAGDTVIVRPGAGVYSEAVQLGRRITLLGDSAAFLAGGRDPLRLPRIGHDLGDAGIMASTPGASYVIRYLAVQNSVDGDAVSLVGAANVILEYVQVNPGTQAFRSGAGINIENVSGSALVARSGVAAVVGYGIRLRNVQNGRVEGTTVSDVGASFTAPGAGVHVVRGANNRIVGSTVRRTDGPQVAFDTSGMGVVSGNNLAGEQALLRILSASAIVIVDNNAFDLRRQFGDPEVVAPATDRAGLEVRASSNVMVSNNGFSDFPGATSRMDAVRLIDARPSAGGAAAVTLTANRISGSRHAIHSERSTWAMTGTRVDNAGVAVYAAAADTMTLTADTLISASAGCVQALGASSSVTVSRSSFVECAGDGTPALAATGSGAVVDVDTSTFVGANQRAISAPQARYVSVRRSSFSGAGTLVLPTTQRTVGAIDVQGSDSVRFSNNDVREYRAFAAASLRGTTVRADSNFVTRNLVGLRVAAYTALARENSLFDNDVLPTSQNRAAVGLASDGALTFSAGGNWWGDDRGPSRAANAAAVGDSAVGQGLPPATYAAQPIAAHLGAGAPAGLRLIRGDSQFVKRNTTAPRKLTVRVVDAAGRPLGTTAATVTFTVASGNGTLTGSTTGTLTVSPNASGLAEATYTTPNQTGVFKASATLGTQTVTFTVTSTP